MASPRDLAITTTGELELDDTGGRLVEGLEAIGQEMRIRLLTWLGEYFLDTEKGLPWLTWAQEKPTPLVLREIVALVRAEAELTSGVVRIAQGGVTVAYDDATRKVTVTVEDIETDLGLLDVVQVEV